MDTARPGGLGRQGGLRLGRYRVAHRIGEGGAGVVYVALDDAGKAYAVKVLKPHVADEPDARQRLAREVDTLRRVQHPAIARVVDADIDCSTPYIVTEYVPAPSLHDDVTRSGRLDDDGLVRLGNGMGQALAAIHGAGVVHRDLKPANVLMDGPDPVLIDFGIAHVVDDSRMTRHSMVMGTPGYLAPELLAGRPVDAATDWWAWAATMAFAATGRSPFGDGPTEAVLDRVRRGAVDLAGVPAPLVEVLARALSVDPAARPLPAELRVALLDLKSHSRGHPVAPAGTPDRLSETTIRLPGVAAERDHTVVLPSVDEPAAAQAWRTPPQGVAAGPQQATADPESVTRILREPSPEVTRVLGEPAPADEPDPRTLVLPGAAEPSLPSAAPWTTVQPAAHSYPQPPAPTAPPSEPHRSGAPTARVRPAGGSTTPPPAPASASAPTQRHSQSPTRRFGIDSLAAPSPTRLPTGQLPGSPVAPRVPMPGLNPTYPPTGASSGPGRVAEQRYAPLTPRTGSLLALAAALTALAGVLPTVALIAGFVVATVARTVDRSKVALDRRRSDRGVSRSDGVVLALGSPFRLLVSAVISLGFLLAAVLAGVSVAYLADLVISSGLVPGGVARWHRIPMFLGAAAAIVTGWWGPGGGAVRYGTRKTVRALAPGPTGAQVFCSVLGLIAVASLIVAIRSRDGLDWWPLSGAPFGWVIG